MGENDSPLAALQDVADPSGLLLAHVNEKEHGALCAAVDGAEELEALSEESLSPHVLNDSHLTPGLGHAVHNPGCLERVSMAVDAGVFVVEANSGYRVISTSSTCLLLVGRLSAQTCQS